MVMVLYMLVIYSYVNGYFTLNVDYIVIRFPKQVLCIHFCFVFLYSCHLLLRSLIQYLIVALSTYSYKTHHEILLLIVVYDYMNELLSFLLLSPR